MALTLADRVRDTTTTLGTGTITLSGAAPTGYQTFESGVGNGNTTYYTINAGVDWEVGIGTYSSTGPTLTRDTVLASSANGAKVDFPAGTKDVFVTYPAERSVYQDGSSIKAGTATLGVANGGTGSTSLTSGYLVKGNGTSAVSASVVYDDGTNVGIGTSSPGVTLDVNGTARMRTSLLVYGSGDRLNIFPQAAGSGVQLLTTNNANSAYAPMTLDGTPIIFNYAGAEVMRLTGTGLGIGTSSPGNKLDIVSAGSSQIRVKDGVGATAYYDFGRDGADGFFGFSGAQTTFSGYKWSVNAGTEAMRITNGGNVGIGTSSPVDKLNVSDGTATFQFKPLGGSSIGYMGMRTNHALGFTTNDTEHMRITSDGRVGIGSTNPNAELQVYKNVANNPVVTRVQQGSSGNPFDYAAITLTTPGVAGSFVAWSPGSIRAGSIWLQTDEAYPLVFGTNDTERARIDSSGNLGIGTSSPTANLDVNADTVRVRTAKTPASATATGNAGDICWDSNYVYVCVATNTWKRSALSTW